jgi:hypothetical protein
MITKEEAKKVYEKLYKKMIEHMYKPNGFPLTPHEMNILEQYITQQPTSQEVEEALEEIGNIDYLERNVYGETLKQQYSKSYNKIKSALSSSVSEDIFSNWKEVKKAIDKAHQSATGINRDYHPFDTAIIGDFYRKVDKYSQNKPHTPNLEQLKNEIISGLKNKHHRLFNVIYNEEFDRFVILNNHKQVYNYIDSKHLSLDGLPLPIAHLITTYFTLLKEEMKNE